MKAKQSKQTDSGFWLGIKLISAEGKEETCFKFWLDVWKPEVTVFPVQMLQNIYVNPWIPCILCPSSPESYVPPFSSLGTWFLSWNISQPLVYCENKRDTEAGKNKSQVKA